jgi:hypothetical protein
MGRSTGISKIILVKGGHGLENVRLNLCSDDFFGTNDWPASTFFISHRASFAKHTKTISKTSIKILGHYCKSNPGRSRSKNIVSTMQNKTKQNILGRQCH